jgi:ABC-type nitrate/sulfonate/bicarbonate transport system substrate-binding protein
MSRTLRLGFVPLNDAAAVLVASEKGFFADEGLEVELSREASWATVRDKLAVGALDGAHMLAPMVVAASLGVGSDPFPMIAPLALTLNGPAVTLSAPLADKVGGPDAAGLARLIARRREEGASPLTLATVFPYSTHSYLLRHWLAQAGVDPDRDVRLTVVPPPRTAGLLAAGVIEGFCAGEPWNAAAVAAGAGRVVARARDIWPDTPDKVFGVTEAWASANGELLSGLLRALVRASAWMETPENRAERAALLARPHLVGLPADLIAESLDDIVFHADGANRPSPQHARWVLEQMVRWEHVDPATDMAAVAARAYRPDLYDLALDA